MKQEYLQRFCHPWYNILHKDLCRSEARRAGTSAHAFGLLEKYCARMFDVSNVISVHPTPNVCKYCASMFDVFWNRRNVTSVHPAPNTGICSIAAFCCAFNTLLGTSSFDVPNLLPKSCHPKPLNPIPCARPTMPLVSFHRCLWGRGSFLFGAIVVRLRLGECHVYAAVGLRG